MFAAAIHLLDGMVAREGLQLRQNTPQDRSSISQLLASLVPDHCHITLLVGSVIPLGMIAVLLRFYAHLMPIAAVAIRLERELMPGRDGLATTYYMLTPKALDAPTSRTAALRRRLLSSGTCRLLGIVSLAHVLIFVFIVMFGHG